ncbi:MAG TPA: nucleotidyltransferase family protein [Jatrophihabitans sp.]|uniref:nucleotidyltransferase family protein n=1 Tax=Jatrophihabitans sp. TaxID=1932789 RepID=UPI002EE5A3AF
MTTAAAVTGIVLAAGAGRRLGRPKADLDIGGQRLVDRAVGTLRAGGCDEVLAVLRPGQAAAEDARTAVNPEPDRGMGSSLRCALAELAADPRSHACVVLLVDLIDVRPAEVAAVIERHRAGAQIVAVRRAGQRSHPVLVSRRWYPELAAAAEGDQGGREFFARRVEDTSFVDYPDPISDIDTAEDLSRALAAHQPPDQAR